MLTVARETDDKEADSQTPLFRRLKKPTQLGSLLTSKRFE